MPKNSLKTYRKSTKSGFGIIELSIFIFIVSVIGALYLKTKTIEATNNTSRQMIENLQLANSAILKYSTIHKKLPCPAALNLENHSSDFGKSVGNDGECLGDGVYIGGSDSNLAYGMVPINKLGLKKSFINDGFNGKIAYIVDKNLTSQDGFSSAINDSTKESIINISNKINQRDQKADFLLISFGKNQKGAFGIANQTQKGLSNLDDEIENSINQNNSPTFDENFVTRSNDREFDDYLLSGKISEINSKFFENRIRFCLQDISETLYDGTTFSWNANAKVGQTIPANQPCPSGYQNGVAYPTRKCNSNGKWSEIINHCQGLCIVTQGSGYKARTVTGQGSFDCDMTGYSGTINYNCSCPTTLSKINNPDFFWRYGSYRTGTNYSYLGWNLSANTSTYYDEGICSLLASAPRRYGQDGQNGCCQANHPKAVGFIGRNPVINVTMDKKYKIGAFDWYGVYNVHGSSRNARNVTFQGLNSSNQWVTLLNFDVPSNSSSLSAIRYNLTIKDYFQRVRFIVNSNWGDSSTKIGGFTFYQVQDSNCDSTNATLSLTGSCTAN